ncbi:MAG: MMPL family transporter [Campylobacterota bacterium]|nr:MMPL family transporter [Campylobacterota bacterium]
MFLKYPLVILSIVFLLVSFLASNINKVDIDASSETLLLKDDKDLEFTRQINKTYGGSEYLVITYSPVKDLLDENTLNDIKEISKKLEKLDNVTSITSILNVPLLQDPSKTIKDIIKYVPTLENDNIDKTLVKKEFLSSALYKEHLVSNDFKTTALLVNLKADLKYNKLLTKRNDLLFKKNSSTLNDEENIELSNITIEFKNHRDNIREINHKTIEDIREIIKQHQDNAELFLGGVNMITDDMISFVKSDVMNYGIIVVMLIILIVWSILKRFRFVLISIIILSSSVLSMVGFIGLFGWEITVVSSNFISLQMIITMSLIIHLSVHYNEELVANKDMPHEEIIKKTIITMFKPCLFVILTTIAGFSSLLASGILPVINLGWMMSVGVFISLLLTFILFPTIMVLFKKPKQPVSKKTDFSLTKNLANFTQNYKKTIFATSAIIMLFSISGSTLLIVENSFIDYFKEDTEIYKGMKIIDKQLGGTTPLDIIINFKESKQVAENINDDDMFDSFEDEFSEMDSEEQYWFTSQKMEKIEQIHNYLDSLKEVGKVLSFATTLKVTRDINNGKDLDNLELAFLYKELPNEYKNILIAPYLNLENNQIRFTIRIIDSMQGLRRGELLERIQKDIHEKFNIEKEDIRLANMMVMYNNMLESLYESQIKTLSIVLVILFIMFIILFKSIKVAFIASIANIIPVGVIFGFMGWIGIPLDMMTITIAAISLGIAVDDTIHYLHRFKEEIKKDSSYLEAIHRSHTSIGNAMYYTTLVIMIGFSVLTLSNFYPTIYFGLLTMLAMFMAVVADLILLPRLILWIKPWK